MIIAHFADIHFSNNIEVLKKQESFLPSIYEKLNNIKPDRIVLAGDTFDKDEHHRWSLLYEIHAEQNALMMAAKYGIAVNNCVMYTSLQPCNNCLKLIIASGIRHVVFYESYDKSNYSKEVLDMINHCDLIIEQYEDICRPRD